MLTGVTPLEYLIPYFNYPVSLDDYRLSSNDAELYLINSYVRSYHYTSTRQDDGIPVFWDIQELFADELDRSGKTLLYVNCFSYKLHRRELTAELLEATLIGMKAEFHTMLGEHVNECQNILLEEMMLRE